MFSFAKLEAELKSFLAKIPVLLYTPQTQHPVLDDVRKLLVAEIQAHLDSVTKAATTLGNNLLQGLEQALQPPAK